MRSKRNLNLTVSFLNVALLFKRPGVFSFGEHNPWTIECISYFKICFRKTSFTLNGTNVLIVNNYPVTKNKPMYHARISKQI